MVIFEIQEAQRDLLSMNYICKWGAAVGRSVIGVSMAFVVCENDMASALSYISHFMGALVFHIDHTENTYKYIGAMSDHFYHKFNNNINTTSFAPKSL